MNVHRDQKILPFPSSKRASNFATGANFGGQLMASWPVAIECPGATQYLLCFPASCCVGKCRNCIFKCQNVCGTFKMLVNARSGVDQVLSARRPCGVVSWPSFKFIDRRCLFPSTDGPQFPTERVPGRGVRWTPLNLTRGSDFGKRLFYISESFYPCSQISIPAIAVSSFTQTLNRQYRIFIL